METKSSFTFQEPLQGLGGESVDSFPSENSAD